jgi:ferredoxin
MLIIENTGQSVHLTETLHERKQVIVGVRPCDAQGIKALDALFLDTMPVDAYYASRRSNTALIGLACQEMGSTCFCTSLGGAPDDPDGMDLMLTEVEGGYAVQVVTEKGQALLHGLELADYSGELPQLHLNRPLPIPTIETWPAHFNDHWWEVMAERCLSCRACAYVCPTCRCFDIRDEALSTNDGHDRYERIRCWDSCAGAGYRKIAGGHNPRAVKSVRLRNRFYCKFDYYPQQYGPTACTGCGRCIDVCPVNIDITEVLGYLAETGGGR